MEAPKVDDNRVENILDKTGLANLRKTLETWENERPVLVVLFEFYTGKRKNEILDLRWTDIDFECRTFKLQKTKGGKKTVPAPEYQTLNIIEKAHKIRKGSWVFPNTDGL
ncbi:tyrosine-type recombinase/integrase [Desulfospira joergensenii]|uniref:tyrosine-type recombinase/integrase n=1 Tax=Desulfospira joergensenii TaxID=53329 RepID=UPI0003B4988E|nr:tyrosine-type recombinase/integrase [Desulfospira joergensenii]